eukprot:SAG31_NODE_6157_length_2145_cov_2.014663_1_plen_162_part_00
MGLPRQVVGANHRQHDKIPLQRSRWRHGSVCQPDKWRRRVVLCRDAPPGRAGDRNKLIYLWAIANKFLQDVKQSKTNSSTYGQLQIIYLSAAPALQRCPRSCRRRLGRQHQWLRCSEYYYSPATAAAAAGSSSRRAAVSSSPEPELRFSTVCCKSLHTASR